MMFYPVFLVDGAIMYALHHVTSKLGHFLRGAIAKSECYLGVEDEWNFAGATKFPDMAEMYQA